MSPKEGYSQWDAPVKGGFMPQANINSEEYIGQLEGLVEELLKEEPEEQLVKTKMSLLGLEYTADPVERINRVLLALHPDSGIDFEE